MKHCSKTCEIWYGDRPTNSVWNIVYMSTIINMVTVQNFEVMTDKCNIDRICT